MSTAQGKCSKCSRSFKRLDTHLLVSATCRDVRGHFERHAVPPSATMNTIFSTNSTAVNLNVATTLTGNLNCTLSAVHTTHGNSPLGIQDLTLSPVALPISDAASLLSCPPPSPNDSLLHLASLSDQSTRDHPLPPVSTTSDFCPKPRLRLPLSDEDWEKANNFFQHNLVPRVISELSADSKYAVLAEGVYHFFDGVFRSVKENQRCRERQNKHQSRLARQVRLRP